MDVVIMIAQLILGLSILVGLHEAGHMYAAKAFGMRVEKFSIGFPPKVFSKKIGETEYMIGAIPLGGFVKISGMIDESLDTENMAKEPEPWEFQSKTCLAKANCHVGRSDCERNYGNNYFYWFEFHLRRYLYFQG